MLEMAQLAASKAVRPEGPEPVHSRTQTQWAFLTPIPHSGSRAFHVTGYVRPMAYLQPGPSGAIHPKNCCWEQWDFSQE